MAALLLLFVPFFIWLLVAMARTGRHLPYQPPAPRRTRPASRPQPRQAPLGYKATHQLSQRAIRANRTAYVVNQRRNHG
jgi:hypothetical protein